MKKSKKKFLWIVLILVVLVGIGFLWVRAKAKPVYETVNVTRGDITENVSVTGRIKSSDSVLLAFEKGGKVSAVNVKVGDKVFVGQQLVKLDDTDLSAQLLQAQANVDTQKAKLEELKSGTRPEQISVKNAELQKAQQDYSNLYASVHDILSDAYVKADDAVRSKADQLFTNADSDQLQLAFQVSDFQTQVDATTLRRQTAIELAAWKKELAAVTTSTTHADFDALIKNGESHLSVVRAFLGRAFDVVDKSVGLSPTTISTYKTSIGVGRANVSLAISAVTGQEQAISAEAVTVERIQNELALLRAGSTSQSIAAQEAQVKQAEASVASINAQLTKLTVYAPISGIVTKQDAKLGEIASPNTALVSVMTESSLEIEANVPEVDVGRIAVSNAVHITLDAFPGETFEGKVSYIDPAETIIDGVVNFKVTVLFNEANPKFRSGLTANLDIESAKKTGVLLLPEFAVIENDNGKFVRVANTNGTTTDIPVTTGIRSKTGSIEIVSGVVEGEAVVNVGLKVGTGK